MKIFGLDISSGAVLGKVVSVAAAALGLAAVMAPADCAFAQQQVHMGSLPPVIRLGMASWAIPANNGPIVKATISALQRAVGPDRLVVRYYSLAGLAEAIENNQVDIFQSSAGFYLRQYDKGVRALVTAASDRFPDPNNNDGSTIIVAADRVDINDVMDARGMVLAANSPHGFTGFHVPLGEIARRGANPEKFFSNMVFTGEGTGMKGVIDAVASGVADIGFLKLCYLEHFPEYMKKVRVLNQKTDSTPGACKRSTDLYPTWTISATRSASSELSRLVTATLLNMPVTEDGYYWGIANDFSRVDELYKYLRMGPYSYLKEYSVSRFVREYWPFIMLVLVCIAGLILHSARVGKLVETRTAELNAALEKQKALQNQARKAAMRIDELQKTGTVGLLSSMVAHELNQPLAALMLYTKGLVRMQQKGRTQDIEKICEDINKQAKRAYDIVDHVRSYAKGSSERVDLDFSALVERCVGDYEISGRSHAEIRLSVDPDIMVKADAIEMELVVLNLVRNASEALRDVVDGVIVVSVRAEGGFARMTVADNGKIFTRQQIEMLSQPLNSTKRAGLGLGLSIVRSIVENHGGRLSFEANLGKGLRVGVLIPELKPCETAGQKEA